MNPLLIHSEVSSFLSIVEKTWRRVGEISSTNSWKNSVGMPLHLGALPFGIPEMASRRFALRHRGDGISTLCPSASRRWHLGALPFGIAEMASRRFALRHRGDGISDFFQGEFFGQLLIRFDRDSNQGAGPALSPSFQGAGSVRFRGVEMHVEGPDVVGQVLLTLDLSLLDCQFFEEHSFPPDAVEVKKTFRARVYVLEPCGCTELVVSRHLLLKGVRHVSLHS